MLFLIRLWKARKPWEAKSEATVCAALFDETGTLYETEMKDFFLRVAGCEWMLSLPLWTKLSIPIDRVPTSKSCVFCLGIKFLFFPIWPFLWSLPVARIMFLKSSQIQSRGFTNLLCKSVKCLERIKSALQRKRSGILLSPATNLLSDRFHIVDKYLHSLII